MGSSHRNPQSSCWELALGLGWEVSVEAAAPQGFMVLPTLKSASGHHTQGMVNTLLGALFISQLQMKGHPSVLAEMPGLCSGLTFELSRLQGIQDRAPGVCVIY